MAGVPGGVGSSRDLRRPLVGRVAALPLGVAAGELLRPVGVVVFAPVGVTSLKLGAEPEAVRFLPVVAVGEVEVMGVVALAVLSFGVQ